ncbi:MAG: phosphate ABC transporter permease subunit PstC [Armatimonadetes bacterium]|nr:phosphate ABC transporter permease subunit PstC [Armatimonadota bacterium]
MTADRGFRLLAGAAAGATVLVMAALVVELAKSSAPALSQFGAAFLTSRTWDPVHEEFGGLPFLYGTVVSSALALALAVPVALGSAIYLSELAPAWAREPLGVLIELLAAVPSVVYGLWGIFALAPWLREVLEPALGRSLGWLPFFQGPHHGLGLLAGGIVLAIMILPTISSVSREVLRAIPAAYREGALALGATRWETISVVVLPLARSGIVGAVLLGLGRALGETMAVTMVIGNRPDISASLFAPAYTMASVIANELTEATGELYLAALAEVGLLLFVLTLLLNVSARLLVAWVERRG